MRPSRAQDWLDLECRVDRQQEASWASWTLWKGMVIGEREGERRRQGGGSKKWLAKDSDCFITLLPFARERLSAATALGATSMGWTKEGAVVTGPGSAFLVSRPLRARVDVKLGPRYRLLASPAHAPAVGRGISACTCARLDEIDHLYGKAGRARLFRFTTTSSTAVGKAGFYMACFIIAGQHLNPNPLQGGDTLLMLCTSFLALAQATLPT
jgi:hypothetical protein